MGEKEDKEDVPVATKDEAGPSTSHFDDILAGEVAKEEEDHKVQMTEQDGEWGLLELVTTLS